MSPVPDKRRGVKIGTVRGPYKRYRSSPKKRILETADESRDWSVVTENCGVNKNTAYSWVNKQRKDIAADNQPRGGRRHGKVTEAMINEMLYIIGEDPTITLKELASTISEKHGIIPSISKTTVSHHLDGRLYTIKRTHKQAENANVTINKGKRRVYVEEVMAAIGAGKHVIYLDESNVNLFCTRTVGRAVRGQRVVLNVPGSKRLNVHMVAGMSQQGFVKFTCRRGAFKHADVNRWVPMESVYLFRRGYIRELYYY
jgi:transposase